MRVEIMEIRKIRECKERYIGKYNGFSGFLVLFWSVTLGNLSEVQGVFGVRG